MANDSLKHFKLGQGSPANTFLAVWVAAEAGLFEANGLDMTVVPMVGGKEAGPSFRAGLINLMHIGMSSVVRANAAGCDLVTIGSLSNIVRGDLFAAPGINSAEDLKGKMVGISSVGSETDTTTTLALRNIGLTRDDVEIRETGNDRLGMLQRGEMAATTLGEPDRSAAKAAGVTCLLELFENRIPWVYSGLVVRKAYLASNHADVLAAMRAIIEGNALAKADAALATKVLARELNITDPEIAALSYANFKAATPDTCETSRNGAENILSVVNFPGISKNPDDYIDASIQDELRTAGFLDEVEKKYG